MVKRSVLTYETLEALVWKPAILCTLGTCNRCGKQICFGSTLHDVQTFDVLIDRLLREVYCDRTDDVTIENAVMVYNGFVPIHLLGE